MGTEYHEPREQLSERSIDVKRAIDSMREELEAIDWYRQRMQAATSPELRAILDHHQREEIEHFVMLLEWCRRNDEDFAAMLREYLFTDRPILEVEEESPEGSEPPPVVSEREDDRRRTIGRIEERRR
jgi:ferritin-like protein